MNHNYANFVKSAALYTQQAAQVVDAAYGALSDVQTQRQKVAAVAPATLQALTALTRTNGQPFVPAGYEKQASACLQSHDQTLRLLTNVLGEYAKLKEASDRQVPTMGRAAGQPGSKTAAKRTVVFDSADSPAMRLFTELLTD
jgi:hypothetical protein